MSRKRKEKKTLSMRVLEGQNVDYQVVEFPESIHNARGVAEYAGLPVDHVYKTLVVQSNEPRAKPLLVMVAADRSLDLKKLAQGVGVKKLQMARHADAERLTGLKVGGISALVLLNKGFAIYLDEEAILLDEIVVSAGQRGLNLRLDVDDLIQVTGATLVDAGGE